MSYASGRMAAICWSGKLRETGKIRIYTSTTCRETPVFPSAIEINILLKFLLLRLSWQ